jgi:hypothetical protein
MPLPGAGNGFGSKGFFGFLIEFLRHIFNGGCQPFGGCWQRRFLYGRRQFLRDCFGSYGSWGDGGLLSDDFFTARPQGLMPRNVPANLLLPFGT